MLLLWLVVAALIWWYSSGGLFETWLPASVGAIVRMFPNTNLKGPARNVTRAESKSYNLSFTVKSLTIKKGYKITLFTQPNYTGESVTFVDDIVDTTSVPVLRAANFRVHSYIVQSLKNPKVLDYPKYTNKDSVGGDIQCFQNEENVSTCRALCADDTKCMAYTQVLPGYGGSWGKGGCCYKTNATNLGDKSSVDWYSNVAPPRKWTKNDFIVYTTNGTDLRNQPVKGTLTDCKNACSGDNSCVGFSRQKSVADSSYAPCYLKKDITNFPRKFSDSTWQTFTWSY